MHWKSQVAVWLAVIVAALVMLALIKAGGGHAPAGRPDNYPNPAVSVTR